MKHTLSYWENDVAKLWTVQHAGHDPSPPASEEPLLYPAGVHHPRLQAECSSDGWLMMLDDA